MQYIQHMLMRLDVESNLHEFFDVVSIHLEFGKQTGNLHSDTLSHTQESRILNSV